MERNASHFEMWIDEVPTDEQLDEFLGGLNYEPPYCPYHSEQYVEVES